MKPLVVSSMINELVKNRRYLCTLKWHCLLHDWGRIGNGCIYHLCLNIASSRKDRKLKAATYLLCSVQSNSCVGRY